MKLSKHFSLEEFTFSETASRLDIDQTPSSEVLDNLNFLAKELEHVRDLLGHPMLISSGYRSLSLNRHLGSKDTSSHIKGLAIDFICPSYGDPESIVKAIYESNLEYDQCILEYSRWVHLAFSRENPRNQTLIIDKEGVRPFENTIS